MINNLFVILVIWRNCSNSFFKFPRDLEELNE